MRLTRFVTVVLVAGTIATSLGWRAHAQQGATPAPASTDRVTRLDRALEEYVKENRVAGVVVLVLRDGRPIYEKALGWRDREASSPMKMDTIFRIASQTKAITSAAIMMLVEEGRIGLSEPVSRFIPAFAKTTVAEPGRAGVTIVPARRQIQIKDLLTHTSGMSYGTEAHVASMYQAKGLGPAAGAGWYTADKTEPICTTMERLATLPFVSHPGEAYVYGYNTDVLGCVVERAAGMPLDQFIRTRITEPLGMADTHFYLPAAQRDRLAVVYGSRPDGTYERAPAGPLGQGEYVDGPRVSFSGGAGLVSTARDYARFLEMIRNGGVHEGRRLLSSRAVALMTTNQIGDIRRPGRARLRLRVRNHRPIRRARSRSHRGVRLGRRLRLVVPCRAIDAHGARDDDPAPAERDDDREPFSDARLSGVRGREVARRA